MSTNVLQSPSNPINNNPSSFQIPTYTSVINSLKNLILKYTSYHMYNSALFYAEKFLNLSKNYSSSSECIYELANALYLNKEYSRCVELIQSSNLMYHSQRFLILLGQSLLACEDYETIITNLEKEKVPYETNTTDEKEYKFLESIIYLIIGKAYEMQENKQLALNSFLKSLEYNSNNIEAFNSLVDHHLMDNKTKKEFLDKLNFDQNDMWMYDYYKSRIEDNIYMKDKSEIEMDILNNDNNEDVDMDTRNNVMNILYNNNDLDLKKMEAEKYFNIRDYTNAYINLKKINDADFYYFDVIPMLCSSMIELGKIGELYNLAYKLANICSQSYVSYYTIGCYYFAIGKLDSSRRNFQKCYQLNKNMSECWIALGNTYVAQEESDQALAAYRTCLRLFPGCHYSELYIGMEFNKSEFYKQALTSFQNAIKISEKDPLIYNEIGVVYYKQKNYNEARNNFIKGIEYCHEDRSILYQSLLLNLGNCYRKMYLFNEAIDVFMKLYYIDSRNINVLNCIGTTYSLIGNYETALEYFHKANFILSKDKFSKAMIKKCIESMDLAA